MAGKNSMTTLTITINAKQAEDVLKSMNAKLKDTSEELERVREKLNDPKLWGEGETYQGLKDLEKQLSKDEKSLKSAVNTAKTTIRGVTKVLADVSKASYNELTKVRTNLTNSLKNRTRDTEKEIKDYEEAAERLQKIRDEIAERDIDIRGSMTLQKAQEVLAKPEDFSTKSINEAVAAMTKFRDIQEVGSKEWAHWNGYVLNGTKFLETFSTKIKQMQMEDLHLKLYEADPSISDNDLSTLVKYWEAMAAGADKGSQELAYYNKLLEEAQKLTQQRVAKKAGEVMASPGDYSVDEINQAIEATKKLQSAQQPGSVAWSTYGREIENARQVLERFNAEAKESAMSDRLSSISTASTASLAEQKKYWQEMVNATDILNPKLQEYKNNLQEVIHEEQYRSRMAAESVISQVHGGQWQRTIGDTKEAIKQLKEYRSMMDTADAPGLKRIDEVIADLNQKLKESEAGYLSVAEAMSQANDVGEGNFDGTLEDLEKLKKRLEEIRQKEIRLGSPDAEEQIKRIDEAIAKVKQRINAASEEAIDFKKVLKDPKSATFKELEATAKQLEEELKNCVKGTGEFIDKSASLREVNKQLTSIKKEWKEQEDIITKTAKRLASYILVYAGWNEVWGKMKEVFHANIELSDSLADIQKTTGLSAESVGRLSEQINAIDTRTAQQELHELAYEAGKLGISAEEDVLAFVRAGNQLLVALGEDLGGAEAVRSLMKVNAVLGETGKLGVEKALLSTGSAINEISQTSRASAGPIADMVARMGAIGASANMGMADLVALAGTADALGQSAEISGTAFNKFISTLQTNTVDVAYALGMDSKRLQQLMDSGQTIQAIIEIFERMNLKGSMSQLAPVMGDLGSEGARMTQVLTTMAKGVEELKSQVFTSNLAFQEATSVTNEYNIKNESAAAILERMANNLREKVVRSGVVEFLQDVLQYLYYLPNVLERNRSLLFFVRAIMWEIATVSGVKLVSMLGKSLVLAWGNLTKAMTLYNAVAARSVLGSQYATLIKTASGVQKLSIAFRTLTMAIKSNPILIIGTVIASVATAIHHFTEETNKAARAAAEYDEAVRKEQFELENLKIRIDRANTANGERTALIKELNNKYSQYLGFLVTEENYLRNQEYIYKLLNVQIERSLALKMQEKLVSDISSKYSDKQLDAYEDMNRALTNFKGIGEGGARSAMSGLMDSIKEQAKEGSEDINSVIISTLVKASGEFEEKYRKLQESMQTGGKDQEWFDRNLRTIMNNVFGGANIQSLKNAVEEMLEVETAIAQEVNKAADISDANIKSLDNKIKTIKKTEAESLLGEIDSTTDPEVLKELRSKFGDYMRLQQAEAKELSYKKTELNNLTAEEAERLKAVTSEVQKYNSALDKVEGKLAAIGELNIWGDGKTIKDMDVNQLVSMYKQLESDGRKIGTNAAESIQTSYWKGFQDQKKAIEWYYTEAKKIKDELESRGYNTSGKFKWGGDGSSNEAKRKAREEYKAALSALDAYYKEREALIREQGAKEGALPTTVERNVDKLKEQWEKDKQELLKMLLGDASTFNPFANEGYMGVLTQNVFFGKNRDTGYLKNLAIQLSQFGIAMEDGMRNTLSSSLVNTSKLAEDEVEKMRKILLQDDFNEQVAQQYMESLDTLGLLFNLAGNEMVEGDAKLGRQRLEAMREYADKSYSLTAEQLEEQMKQNALFDAWNIGKEREHYEVLLSELRKFHDDQEEADRKSAERRKKLADARFKSTGQQGDAEDALKNYEARLELARQMEGFGIGGKQVVSTLEIDVLKQKISYEQQWLGLLAQESAIKQRQIEQDIKNAELLLSKEKNEERHRELSNQLIQLRNQLANEQNTFAIASAESIDKMLEYQKNASEIYSQQFTEYFDKLKEYQGSIDSFAQSMGEGIFGSKEERQEAGKELLRSVLTTSKNLLQVWLTQLATRRLVDEMEIKQTEATEMRKRAIKLQSMIQDGTIAITGLTVDAAKTEASILLSSAEATGREVAKKGVIGLAIGAAISAALSALLGAALGRVNKAKSEIASETGASGGKLVTGMLTYASGNYPVLGNDGKVYDAQYEGSSMKTGIYRGGAHFGIFSEKKPEAIIDGDTTQRLIMNHPDIWKAIVTLSKNGRLDSSMGVRTFAGGNIHDLAGQDAGISGGADNSAQLAQMQAIIDGNSRVMAQLTQLLAGGIHANVNMYGSGGVYESMQKAEKFMGRRGR